MAAEARLQKKYNEEIASALKEQFSYENVHQIPKLEKIVLNMGVGDSTQDSRRAGVAAEQMTQIAGQRAVVTKAKKSVAGFKVREGMPLGCKVTLRGKRMYEFLDRLVTIAMPRIRDFRGVSAKSFDGNGNYAMGIKEQIIFPELPYDKVDQVRGMDIIICTSANSDHEARALLEKFNFPFRK